MQVHELIQGTPEWHAHRASHFNASDAPAVLGCSPYKTRSQLLHEMHTSMAPEVDAATQRRFDDGHRFERLARPLAEKIIGEDLYPVSGSQDFGLDKPLGASLDGSTITDEIIWEHKSLNAELRALLPEQIVGEVFIGSAALGAKLPKLYRAQMEHQLMVSGATKVLFTASIWMPYDELGEARHCWYESDPALRAEILAGWAQFAEDLKAYTPPAVSAVEKIVAEPVEALPAVLVQVSGEIAVRDNFKVFETALRNFLDNRLIREPKTDQDFADLDLQIKSMKGAEEALDAAEGQMLAQVQSIDQAKKTKDLLAKLLRENRLASEKILKAEKERRRGEIVADGVAAFAKHIKGLNERLGKEYMPAVPVNFGGVISGLKSLASMENAVKTELSRAKIAANDIADKLQKNLDYLRANAAEFKHLFHDTEQIIGKAHDDLQALVQNRINTEKARVQAEHDKIREDAAEAARKKLVDEQAAKNEMALQEIQGIQQQAIIAQAGRLGVRKGGTIECIRETLAETEAWTITEEKFGALTTAAQAAKDKAVADIRTLLVEAETKAATQTTIATAAQTAAPAVQTVKQQDTRDPDMDGMLPTPAAPAPAKPEIVARLVIGPTEKPTLKLGDICARLDPEHKGFTVTADFLASLGFEATTVRNAKMYFESDWPAICEALIQHLTQVADLQPA